MPPKKKQTVEEMQKEAEMEAATNFVGDMTVAKVGAAKLFGGEQLPEIVFEVYDRLIVDAESEDEQLEDLTNSQTIAVEMFGPSPSPAAVFGVFDRLFADQGEDDDEDEDDEE